MDSINFTVADEEYQLLPHTGFEALDLDRKVLGLVGRVARQGLDASDDVEAFALLANTLSEMPTRDFRWLLETTLERVTVVTKGKKFRTLDSSEAIAEHFESNRAQMYAVLLQVWKLEKLSPFVTAPATGRNGA